MVKCSETLNLTLWAVPQKGLHICTAVPRPRAPVELLVGGSAAARTTCLHAAPREKDETRREMRRYYWKDDERNCHARVVQDEAEDEVAARRADGDLADLEDADHLDAHGQSHQRRRWRRTHVRPLREHHREGDAPAHERDCVEGRLPRGPPHRRGRATATLAALAAPRHDGPFLVHAEGNPDGVQPSDEARDRRWPTRARESPGREHATRDAEHRAVLQHVPATPKTARCDPTPPGLQP